MYTENQLVEIGKRENNNKRKYLVINKLQGKHIPVSPTRALLMFDALGELIENSYGGERLLVIGFAETATAIGAAVANRLNCDYIQTTRELVDGAEYLFFSEDHSHATEQTLVKNQLGETISRIDRIVFVEDEITTGNTILNSIRVMEEEFGKELCFSVASILNGMKKEYREIYEAKGIAIHNLVKTSHDTYEETAKAVRGDGEYLVSWGNEEEEVCWHEFREGLNARRLVRSQDYEKACLKLWEMVDLKIPREAGERILVLGTEEFMYPALYVARKLEEGGCEVTFHATTRSPIATSLEETYPLRQRFELKSFYDRERTTYIYNLSCCDQVFVITDASSVQTGWTSLLEALKLRGNKKINWIRWCENEKFL